MTIADRLTETREAAGLSQAELASMAGVSQGTIGNIEAGIRKNPRELLAIAKALNVEAEWLKSGKSPRTAEHRGAAIGRRFQLIEDAEGDFGYRVPHLEVSGSMGDGSFVADHVDVVKQIGVNVDQLRRQCSFTSPANLNFITGYGNSMEPTFSDGDVLLVDVGIREVNIDGVYVLHLNGKLYIKTLQRRPDGSVLMISDNKKYEPYPIRESDQIEVNGRVVLAWNARRL